jgi:plasmid stabilization system protein ParE
MPLAGRVVPEFEREDIREVFLKGYRIVYCVSPDEIAIVAVLEGHRLFPPERIPPKK